MGYYDGEKLIAVMDLILTYPDEQTAFIGFFMTLPVLFAAKNTGTLTESSRKLRAFRW